MRAVESLGSGVSTKGMTMAEETVGCGRVTGTVGGDTPAEGQPPETTTSQEVHVGVTVGQQAPDFKAPAYYQGGFTQVSLSDFAGKWVLLCFYPGDFTFV